MEHISIITIGHQHGEIIEKIANFGEAICTAIRTQLQGARSACTEIKIGAITVGKVHATHLAHKSTVSEISPHEGEQHSHCCAVAIIPWFNLEIITRDPRFGETFAEEMREHPMVENFWDSVYTSDERRSTTGAIIVATLAPGYRAVFDHTVFNTTRIISPSQ